MKLFKSLLIMGALAGSSYAATISFTIASNTGVATSSGVGLNSSYTAYIGTYTGGVLDPLTATFTDINAGFQTLYSATFATGDVDGFNGYLAAGAFNFTDAAGFANDPLYVFITDGANQNALVAGFGNIPADASIPNSVDFGVDSANAPTLTYVVGSYNASGANLAGEGGNIELNNVVIPEPSAALLGALGALGLLRRRRI